MQEASNIKTPQGFHFLAVHDDLDSKDKTHESSNDVVLLDDKSHSAPSLGAE